MSVVKNLAYIDKMRLMELDVFKESKLDILSLGAFPFDFIHSLLPYKLKFAQESFVLIDNNKVKGLVSFEKTAAKRMKITRLLLDENSLESGKFLTSCTINLFLSKGAEAFYVISDKLNIPLITMFKEGLGFQEFASEKIYKVKKNDLMNTDAGYNFEFVRKMTNRDIKEVQNLINENMFSYQKSIFYADSSFMKLDNISGGKHFVLFDEKNNKISGCFKIKKLKKTEYSLEFVLSKGYEVYLLDIIKFVRTRILSFKKYDVLYIKLKNYYMNFKEMSEILNIEFKDVKENIILAKTYLTSKTKDYAFDRMIFNDATPAF